MEEALFIILCLFSIYGIFSFIYDIIFENASKKLHKGFYTFNTVIVSNENNNLEEYVNFISESDKVNDLYVIDKTDKCDVFINALASRYEFIKHVKAEEYIKNFNEVITTK